jgi:O-acetyl-ADP-ribose deacetylase (regulator of RNase III)
MGVHPIKSLSFMGGRSFHVVIYDLLYENVDCIVNAANGGLSHGGGIATAIAKAAGPELEEECEKIVKERGHIPVGEAVATTSGKLPFKGIIHAVGPRFGDGNEGIKIASALHSGFLIAAENGWRSLSFPAISSGIFSVPHDICARAYVQASAEFLGNYRDASLKIIRLCLHKGPLVDEVLKVMDSWIADEPPPPQNDPDDEDIPTYEIELDEDL